MIRVSGHSTLLHIEKWTREIANNKQETLSIWQMWSGAVHAFAEGGQITVVLSIVERTQFDVQSSKGSALQHGCLSVVVRVLDVESLGKRKREQSMICRNEDNIRWLSFGWLRRESIKVPLSQ